MEQSRLTEPEIDIALSDDERLLGRTAAGDKDAFAQLVRLHQLRVTQLAMRLLASPHKAEDITQEAFVRVFRSAGRFQPRAKFTTWLHRIVVNLCLDERRRWRVNAEQIETELPAPTTTNRTELDELKSAVHRAVDELPQRQRMVLVLHRFEGLGCREIAQTLDLTESAVESMLVRAYANLRKSLGSMHEDWAAGGTNATR